MLVRLHPYPWHRLPYEYSLRKIHKDEPDSCQYEYDELPSKDWRYWIISFEGCNSEIQDLEFAAALLKNELELGFTVLGDVPGLPSGEGGGYMWNMPSLTSYFLDDPHGMRRSAIRICPGDIQEIGVNYALVRGISAEHKHIQRAFQRFDTLKSLPRKSDLMVIGLFSIIESLITHCPKSTESSDSLMHQIKTKIPLLRKRFERPLDYEDFFDPASEETIWSKLYGYRSRIVHGEQTDIDSRLQILRSGESVIAFLRETVKLLLLLALKEPVLLTDLKRC